MGNEISFKLKTDTQVLILRDGWPIGHIFSPAGSGEDVANAIQVCGFSEAYSLWACGIYKGFKDIQLLYDKTKLRGEYEPNNCWCCFHNPCQCETAKDKRTGITKGMPFVVKGWRELNRMEHLAKGESAKHDCSFKLASARLFDFKKKTMVCSCGKTLKEYLKEKRKG